MTVNGAAYDKNYLTHETLLKGGNINFVMSAQPNTSRGTDEAAAPYSFVITSYSIHYTKLYEDNDPYQTVQEWWNTGENKYAAPADHLVEKMNIGAQPHEGEYHYGKGTVYVFRHDPKEYVLTENGDTAFVDKVKKLYEGNAKAGKLVFKNSFFLQRGNYDLISVLDESVSKDTYLQKGLFVDLFDPELPVLTEKIVIPGSQAFLYDIKRVQQKNKPQVLARNNFV